MRDLITCRNALKAGLKHQGFIWILVIGIMYYAANTWLLVDPATFGMWHDDTLLFASAKSLAEGTGYRLPSWPGGLPQTKYPPLYPVTLSVCWLLWPAFPGNLGLAFSITAVFGLLFVTGCWTLLRSLEVSSLKAACIAAACAAHPTVAMLSASVLADVPFAALVVWCAATADRAMASASRRRLILWGLASVLAALAILTRTLGLALPLAMAVAASRAKLGRPEWAMLSAPFGAAIAWTAWAASVAPDVNPDAPLGYMQTLVFYSSYLRFWAMSVPDWNALMTMLPINLLHYVCEPAAMSLQIPELKSTLSFLLLSAAITIFISLGLIRRLLSRNSSILHLALIPYSAAVLLWNYPLMWRFMLPFLPLFLLALVEQAERALAVVVPAASSRWIPLRLLGWTYVLLFAFTGASSLSSYLWRAPEDFRQVVRARKAMDSSQDELYAWVRRNTASEARFIAYEDVLLHLNTGRASLRPIALTTASIYRSDPIVQEESLALIGDTAAFSDADYWVVDADDYKLEPQNAIEPLRENTLNLFESQPPAFSSSDGRIQVYPWNYLPQSAP